MASNTVPFLRDTLSRTTFPACGLTLDIGRQRMTEADFNSLLEIAREKGVLGANAAMREGQIVNASEGRAALHTALRDPAVGAPPPPAAPAAPAPPRAPAADVVAEATRSLT